MAGLDLRSACRAELSERRCGIRILIAEELHRGLLDARKRLIAGADVCWAFSAHDGATALEALSDRRWRTGDYGLFDRADVALWKWAHESAGQVRPSTPVQEAMIAYGLQARLRSSARARAFVERVVAEAGLPAEAVSLDVVASDPYLRAAFAPEQARVRLFPDVGRTPLMARLRESAAGSGTVRKIIEFTDRRRAPAARRRSGTVGLFVFGQRPHDVFLPVARELEARGWRVVVFHYRPITTSLEAIVFDDAARPEGRSYPRTRRLRTRPLELVGSPVPPESALRAYQASWQTALVQLERHRRVLARWRPDVVVSYGPDTMSLALQGAAAEMVIPSVFLPHGFLDPWPYSWGYLHATALAVAGPACAAVNAADPLGRRQLGFVVVGHPDYDALLTAREMPADAIDRALGMSADRPHIVLLFAEWAIDLPGHAIQIRTLQRVARALPRSALLVCKLHPARQERAMCMAVLGAELEEGAFRIVADDQVSTPALLRSARVAVAAEQSMALSDAVAAAVPVIAMRHPEKPWGTYDLNHPARDYSSVGRVVNDVEELREAMAELIQDGEARRAAIHGRDGYMRRFLLSGDGGSSRRIADLVEHLRAHGRIEGFMDPPSAVDATPPPDPARQRVP